MRMLRINGGNRLMGSVPVQGAKNSVLPIMAAAILANGETVIHNCPDLKDVTAAVAILRHLGCRVTLENHTVVIDSSTMDRCDIPHSLMREMRSSVIFLGAILSRFGEAVLSLPGGCELGPRPIDLHLLALRKMGAEIIEQDGNIICRGKPLHGCHVNLDFPSVGATENCILAACCSDGVTVISNAAREPEILDLQKYLRRLGAKVFGAGTAVVTVEGSQFHQYAEHFVLPDRIVTATLLSAVASAGGEILLTGVVPEHVETVMDVLSQMGCAIAAEQDRIWMTRSGRLKAPRPVITKPYPGFPTDAQPPVLAACLKATGTAVFIENIFENRFRYVAELQRMGADIKTEGRVAIVSGVRRLQAATVTATDLRGGAALAVAALGAEGITDILAPEHIERGYEDLALTLRTLGANAVML